MKVLLVEDEERIVSFLRKGLSRHGYEVELAATGREALRRAGTADIVILDLGLPDMDGLDVLSALRTADVDAQVIVLTARGDVDDRVEGLERGADDYLAKPFAFEELLARIRARVRTLEERDRRVLYHADVRMDLLARRVTVADDPVDLSTREFAMLEAFLHDPSSVLSRPVLLSRVWGLEFDPQSNLVDVYVRTLRKKLGSHRIETVKGSGYRLAAPA
jgi:two-component system copper resistance phosphate regulon response regulator CusR